MSEKDLQKNENSTVTGKIRNVKTFTPRVDIYETKEAIFLTADMPGIDEKTVDVELEKNILTIAGRVENGKVKDYNLIFFRI